MTVVGRAGEATVDDWEVVEAEWRRRDHTRLVEVVGRAGGAAAWAAALRDTSLSGAEVAGLPPGIRGGRADDPRPGGGPLTAAVEALLDLSDEPVHRAAVAALVYLESLRAWESTDERRQMRALAVALDRAFAPAAPDRVEGRLVAAVVDLAWAVLEEVEVENGVFCSCPIAAAEHSERTVALADAALALVDSAPFPAELVGLANVVRADAAVVRRYFADVVTVSDATVEWIDDPGASVSRLDHAIDVARSGSRALEPDVFASELNTHRIALEHMRDAAHRPRLHVADGTIAYLYPFGLPEVAPEELVERVRVDGGAPATLGGLDVAPEPEAFSFGGTWQQEWCLGKFNEAVVLRLPELEIETTAAAPHPGSHRALPDDYTVIRGLRPEVRLSSLGTHVLRIEVPVEDLELHSLDQALRRVGESIGRERIRTVDGDAVPGGYLCRLADEVIADLREHMLGDETSDTSARDPGARQQDLLASAHVVLSVRDLRIVDASGSKPCPPDAVAGALGASVVLGPPRPLAGGFEWWVAQGVGPIENLLEGHGLGSGLLVRGLGSTFVYAPDLPDWQAADLDSIAEHVATVSGALHAWGDHLGHYEVMVSRDLRRVEARQLDPDAVGQRMRELARDASRVRAMLGQVRPVNLCRQVSDRVLVERVGRAAGLAEVERAVQDGLEVLSAQQERLAAEAERLRAEVDRGAAEAQEKVQRRMDLWISIIGLTSLIGFFDFLNRAFGWEDRAAVLLGECAAVVFVVLSTTGWYVSRHKAARQSRRVDGGPD